MRPTSEAYLEGMKTEGFSFQRALFYLSSEAYLEGMKTLFKLILLDPVGTRPKPTSKE